MEKNQQTQIAGAILIVGVLIAGAILLRGNIKPAVAPIANQPSVATDLASIKINPVSADEHILGNKNAKVVIIEYSDTECPFCKVFHKTMHQIIAENNGNVAWVYRHYPIPQLHTKAFREAEATECAWEQGGNNTFWKYVDRLFEVTPSNNGLDEAELSTIAAYIGLDVPSFNTCLQGEKYKGKVQASIDDGARAGVNGTPSSFILNNGKVVDNIAGAQPFEMVNQKIKSVLK